MLNELIREATNEEMKAYNKVEKYFDTLTEEEEEKLIKKIGDFTYSYGRERKITYTRLYRYIKKNSLDITPLEFETWYCIDVY